MRLVMVIAMIMLSRPGWAAPGQRPVRLNVSLPADGSCPDSSILRRGVIGRLGRDPFGNGTASLQVDIEGKDGLFVARVVLRDGGSVLGERRLVSRGGCVPLFGAVALAASLVIDGWARDEAAQTSTPPWQGSLAMSTGVVLGELPGPAPALGVELRLDRGGWVLGAEVRGTFRDEAQGDIGQVSAWQVGIGGALCRALGPVDLCAVTRGGWLVASGVDFDMNETTSAPAVGAGVGARWGWALGGRWRLVASAELLGSLVGPRLVRSDGAEVWTAPPATFALGLAVAARMW